MKIVNKVSTLVGRKGLIIKKYSPEILLGVGVVGVVTATVLACKATLKVSTIVDDAKEAFEVVNNSVGEPLTDGKLYSEEDKSKDKTIVYVQSGVKIVKAYLPAVVVGTISIAAIIGGHRILKRRTVALAAAYKAVDSAFKKYRERVVKDLGEDKDKLYKYGDFEELQEQLDNDTKDGTVEQIKKYNETSEYARFFDDASVEWQKEKSYNVHFLRCQQEYFTQLLQTRGHVFLNEVYDALGLPRCPAGQVVGWLKDGDNSDGFVDFGLFKDGVNGATTGFLNCWEPNALLDFNVDGVIYDLI